MSRTTAIATVLVMSVGVLAVLAYARTEAQDVRGPFVGSYAATLSRAQASARGDSRLAGRFTLVLGRDGTYSVSNPLDGRMNGQLTALGDDRLRFSNDSGCTSGGFERPEGGTYRWSLNGERLTLRLLSEGPCTGRTDTLTFPIWIRR